MELPGLNRRHPVRFPAVTKIRVPPTKATRSHRQTGALDNTAKVWDAASGRELLTLEGQNDSVWSVAFSPDGRRIVTGSGNRAAKVWEAASGRELLTIKGHNSAVASVAFSPDGQRILTGSADGTARVWEAARKEEIAQWQTEEAVEAQH